MSHRVDHERLRVEKDEGGPYKSHEEAHAELESEIGKRRAHHEERLRFADQHHKRRVHRHALIQLEQALQVAQKRAKEATA